MADLGVVDNASESPAKGSSAFDLGPGAHQCWYPVALSTQVPAGGTLGRDLGDGRVIIYRGEDGVIRIMSAYCKHMGADLSFGGEVVGNNIRCPFHQWAYGDGGQCKHIPSGDAIPRNTNLVHLPAKEQFGLIWVFFGETPLYELQTFEDFDEEVHVARSYESQLSDILLCEPWVFTTNIFDLVHLRLLHGINVTNSNLEKVDPYRWRMNWVADLGAKAPGGWRPEIYVYGTNSIRTVGDQAGRLKWYIASGTPMGREGTKFFFTIVTTKDDGAEEFLDRQATMHSAIQNEDLPVLNNLRYGDFHLVKSDQALTRFMRTALKYPRTTLKAMERAANMTAS